MKKGKPFARAGDARSPVKAKLELTNAYRRLFVIGNGTQEDAEVVLTDLMAHFGYYRRPNYAEWMRNTGGPDGFELHSALCNARIEVLQYIMDFLLMDDDRLIELERAARLESR